MIISRLFLAPHMDGMTQGGHAMQCFKASRLLSLEEPCLHILLNIRMYIPYTYSV